MRPKLLFSYSCFERDKQTEELETYFSRRVNLFEKKVVTLLGR